MCRIPAKKATANYFKPGQRAAILPSVAGDFRRSLNFPSSRRKSSGAAANADAIRKRSLDPDGINNRENELGSKELVGGSRLKVVLA